MTKFKLIKTLAISVGLSSGLAILSNGCSHPDAPVFNQRILPLTETDWTQSGFANPNNPYDSVGALHNEGLNYVASHLSSVLSDDTLYPGTDTLAVLFCDSALGYFSGSGADDSLSAHLHAARFALTHSDSLNSVQLWGSQAAAYISEIKAIASGSDSVAEKISAIEAIEDSAATILTGASQVYVLSVGAIARYSTSYWNSSDTANWAADAHKMLDQPYGRAAVDFAKRHSFTPQFTWPKWANNDAIGGLAGAASYGMGWFVPGGWVGGLGYTLIGAVAGSCML